MAETLCTLRTKGGGGGAKYTETVLWQNPSPNAAFAAQAVTLSDSISNYKYVAIYYKYAGTKDGVNDPMPVIVPVDKFKTSLKNTMHNILILGAVTNGNAVWARNVFYASDTTIEFDIGYKENAASNSGDICVPTEILGLNELAHGTVQTATGTCERGVSPVTVNLGFRPSFVSIYKTNASSSGTSVGDSLFVADTGFSTSYALSAYKESSGSTFTKVAMNKYITITDTGFTFASSSIATFRGTYRYVAIGSTTE